MGREARTTDLQVAGLQGPDRALEEFVRREHPRLVGALSLYLGDVETAEDLAQEALIRVCRNWARVGALESPGGWVHHVAMNLAASAARSRQAGHRAVDRLSARSAGGGSPDVADAVAVRTALARLEERQRRALILRYYADLPVAVVAEILRCPEGTVKTLTSRAIAALRAQGWEVQE